LDLQGIAVHACGPPLELVDGPLPLLEERLLQEAEKACHEQWKKGIIYTTHLL